MSPSTPMRGAPGLLALALMVAAAPCQEPGEGREPGGTPERWPVSLMTLLPDMIDLEGLARFPDPPWATRQFSSYDRASVSPGREGWFANRDAGNFLRVEEVEERREHVMAEAEGPGALVRIWSANPAGTLRIYLDGAAEPAIEGPMEDILGGADPRFPEPLAGRRARGWNLYYPLPYRRSVKVTSDAGGFYYHVGYRTWPEGTEVRTWTAEQAREQAPEVHRISRALQESTRLVAHRSPRVDRRRLEVGPGERAVFHEHAVAEGEGGAAVAFLGFELAPPEGRPPAPEVLRSTVLLASFDGERTVEVPLGDFFGSAPGIRTAHGLPVGMEAPGLLVSRWVMPFRERCELALMNHGGEGLEVRSTVGLRPWRWTSRCLHFHAGWRQGKGLPTRPFRDWSLLQVRGRDVLVGTALSIANPVRSWWGEGDEKIYVDGEAFPSTFGTGTEDYFGYAWCSPETFTHAYHAQPRCDGPGNHGFTSVNRWHVLDAMPFEESLRFDLELWHHAEDTEVAFATTCWWYAAPGAEDGFAPLTPGDLVVPEIPPYEVHRVPGALEAEALEVLEVDGAVQVQELGPPFSGEAQLWWREARPEGRLVLGFEAPEAGRYRLLARFCRSYDYGIHQVSVNGREVGEPIDLHAPRITAADEVPIGTFDLGAGLQRFGLRVSGTSPEASPKRYMAGLDYLRLEPAGGR